MNYCCYFFKVLVGVVGGLMVGFYILVFVDILVVNLELNVWVLIQLDEMVVICIVCFEMGQGMLIGFVQLVVEEFGCDWVCVCIEYFMFGQNLVCNCVWGSFLMGGSCGICEFNDYVCKGGVVVWMMLVVVVVVQW